MFAYCGNNFVNRIDLGGAISALALHAVVGGISGGLVAAGAYVALHRNFNAYDFGVAVGIGIVNGIVSGVVNEFKLFAIIGSSVISGFYAAQQYKGSETEKVLVFLTAGTITAINTWVGTVTPSMASQSGSSGIDALASIIGDSHLNSVMSTNSEIVSSIAQFAIGKSSYSAKRIILKNTSKDSWLYKQVIIDGGRARRRTN